MNFILLKSFTEQLFFSNKFVLEKICLLVFSDKKTKQEIFAYLVGCLGVTFTQFFIYYIFIMKLYLLKF